MPNLKKLKFFVIHNVAISASIKLVVQPLAEPARSILINFITMPI